mmetsp:Transcript_2460/g.2093  ORF Transcript_2460/g.2093 Transcript_2460/m.2093 type:complete len:119 (+) Transcript_2460:397-753(+)
MYNPSAIPPSERGGDEKSLTERLMEEKKIRDGTILKIFDGSLKIFENKTLNKMALYSCNSFKLINSLPQIDDGSSGIKIQGKLLKTKFQSYLNKSLNTIEFNLDRIATGWVESHMSLY